MWVFLCQAPAWKFRQESQGEPPLSEPFNLSLRPYGSGNPPGKRECLAGLVPRMGLWFRRNASDDNR